MTLTGPRGDSPYGVLVSYGLLSLLARTTDPQATLHWTARGDGMWLPVLATGAADDLDSLADVTASALDRDALTGLPAVAGDLNRMPSERLRDALVDRDAAVAAALTGLSSELPLRPDGRAAMTPLCIVSFKGRRSVFDLVVRNDARTTVECVRGVLEGPWRYARGVGSLSLDPDARQQDSARMGPDASADGTRGVPGALSLAVRGLQLVPPLVSRRRPIRQGALARNAFSWPLWTWPATFTTARWIAGRDWAKRLDAAGSSGRALLEAAGIEALFRAAIVEAKDGRRLALATRIA